MMKKKITRLSVLQTGKFLAVFYALFSLIMLPFFLLGPKGSGGMALIVIIYPVMGFIGGILMAAFYNLTSKWVGGIEVTLED
jgi:hypothetical protein